MNRSIQKVRKEPEGRRISKFTRLLLISPIAAFLYYFLVGFVLNTLSNASSYDEVPLIDVLPPEATDFEQRMHTLLFFHAFFGLFLIGLSILLCGIGILAVLYQLLKRRIYEK